MPLADRLANSLPTFYNFENGNSMYKTRTKPLSISDETIANMINKLSLGVPPSKFLRELVKNAYDAHERAGSGGFGYDCLFHHPESGCTFGEIEPHVKNRLSHRAVALQKVRVLLERAASAAAGA